MAENESSFEPNDPGTDPEGVRPSDPTVSIPRTGDRTVEIRQAKGGSSSGLPPLMPKDPTVLTEMGAVPPAPSPKTWSPFDWVVVALGTGLFVGMVPPRTATIATTWGIPLAIGLYHLVGWTGYLPVLFVLWVIGIPICGRSARLLGRKDPREVVYDEYSTLPLVYFLVPNFGWRILVLGFVLHRIFDISKPFGIRRLEWMKGGLGIMIDDVAASIIALAILQSLLAFGVVH